MWNNNFNDSAKDKKEDVIEIKVDYDELLESYNKNNLYLYAQIVFVMIFLVAGVMMKFNGGNSFSNVKEDYKMFFNSETVLESNFSYESFLENLKNEITERYENLMQAISHAYGQGANNLYPSDVSLKKYTLENQGKKPLIGYITSSFGVRKDPFNPKNSDFHTGMDISADKGTFIKAAFSGTVAAAGYSNIAGNYIKIITDDSLQSFYGHSQFLFVKEGESILQGQVIATVGETGMATGPHLHFEIVKNGVRVNPIYAIE